MPSELLFSRGGGRFWAAVREGGEIVELRVEREREPLGVGRLVKGRVSRILPGIQAAFLDVGQDREAFLHAADLILPGEPIPGHEPEGAPSLALEEDGEAEPEVAPELAAPLLAAAVRDVPIEARLRVGNEFLVQIMREALGNKGPRATCFASLAGRHLVYMPRLAYRAISRRIAEGEERDRLRTIVQGLPAPSGGFIVRTAAAGVGEPSIRADAETLVARWQAIVREAEAVSAPALIHSDHDMAIRMLQDADREMVERILVDDTGLHARIREFLDRVEPALAQKVRFHEGPEPLFSASGVAVDIERALRPRVWLRSGGTLIIEQTEALVSIDVNSAKFVGTQGPEETALRTNLEAAEEIARQLRLRDLGGIIVIDFIDMERAENGRRVLDALESALSRDRARTKIVGLSELGLVQLTRKRTRAGFAQTVTQPCPVCRGVGRVKSGEVVAGEALQETARILRAVPGTIATIRAHPEVARAIRIVLQEGAGAFAALASSVRVEDDPTSQVDRFAVRVL